MGRYHYSMYTGVYHTGVSLKSKLAAFGAGLASLSLAVALPLTAGAAPSTVFVTPSNTQGWAVSDDRNAGHSVISADQPDDSGGAGSLKQSLTNSTDKATYRKLGNSGPVNSLSNLSFDWYRSSSSTAAGHFTPAFGLYVSDASGQNSWLLKWEGVYNEYPAANGAVPTDQWVNENILAGNFWRIPQLQNGVFVGFSGCGQAGDPYQCAVYDRHLDDSWLAGYNVAGVEVGVGSGWTGTYLSYVDNVTVGATNYNFELVVADTVSVPVILSPANGAQLTSAQATSIDWTDSTATYGPVTYQYRAYYDAGYTNLAYDSGNTLTSSQIPTPGTPNGTYYVQVQAFDAYGVASGWSNDATNPYKITVRDLATPASADKCKNDGWKTLTDANGKAFKNQGSCVSYVVAKS